MKSIAPFLVMIAILIAITVMLRAFLDHKIKKYIIEFKPIDERMMKILNMLSGFESDALKWGITMLFGGIGLVVIEFIPYDPNHSPLPYGVELIFLSAGFLFYYLIRRSGKQ
ncbi:MAG: hypothetical protein JNM68_04845 [Dinghuibacter sp.]|nr:hypothetical protein [Dinghuibacter sp.]